MKKLFLSAIALLGLFASNAFAQDNALAGNKIGIGLEFSMPNGGLSTYYPIGYGASANYIHEISQKFKLTGNAGFISYPASNKTTGLESLQIIPIKVGGRYYVTNNIYAAGELGTAFSPKKTASTIPFTYSPGIGVDFPISDKMTVDVSGRYDGWAVKGGSTSFWGIRAALNFGL